MGVREQLLAVGPIDGRYADKVESLVPIASEYGLIHRRLDAQIGWLGVLGSGILPDRKPLSATAQGRLRKIGENFSIEDAEAIKAIEKTTRHDLNAVVRWLQEKIETLPGFKDYQEMVHFGCTSEDTNNLAYAMMYNDAREEILIPGIVNIIEGLEDRADRYADTPMLAHTHGQPATPTTLGKEMTVFAERLRRSTTRLGSISITGKLNGATGSYNAMAFAYPEVDWAQVSQDFVRSHGFTVHKATTQTEPHDWIAAFNNELALNNSIMIDAARDIWTYISLGYLKQEVVEEEDGSSTMPNKVNPIDFENAEGNLGVANAILRHLSEKLPISRMQRDLSDSSALRSTGEAFGHTVVAHSSFNRGMSKIYPDEERMTQDLNSDWSILTEAVVALMRKEGVSGAYDEIKKAARGMIMKEADYLRLVANTDLPLDERRRLASLTPAAYIGRAPEIARREI